MSSLMIGQLIGRYLLVDAVCSLMGGVPDDLL